MFFYYLLDELQNQNALQNFMLNKKSDDICALQEDTSYIMKQTKDNQHINVQKSTTKLNFLNWQKYQKSQYRQYITCGYLLKTWISQGKVEQKYFYVNNYWKRKKEMQRKKIKVRNFKQKKNT